jgi:hypothetical protein
MKSNLILLAFLSVALYATAWAESDEEILTHMLNEFLSGASINDAAAHDRFWAEDLVYTSSKGLPRHKPHVAGLLVRDMGGYITGTQWRGEPLDQRDVIEPAAMIFRDIQRGDFQDDPV